MPKGKVKRNIEPQISVSDLTKKLPAKMAVHRSTRQDSRCSNPIQKNLDLKTSKEKVDCKDRSKVTSLSSITEKHLSDEKYISTEGTSILSQNEMSLSECTKEVNTSPKNYDRQNIQTKLPNDGSLTGYLAGGIDHTPDTSVIPPSPLLHLTHWMWEGIFPWCLKL